MTAYYSEVTSENTTKPGESFTDGKRVIFPAKFSDEKSENNCHSQNI